MWWGGVGRRRKEQEIKATETNNTFMFEKLATKKNTLTSTEMTN
jgi:hypothetical protein